jgi:threonine synthase
MDHVTGLKCVVCGRDYAVDELDYICPDLGDEGILDVCYHDLIGKRLRRLDLRLSMDDSIWRYRVGPFPLHAPVKGYSLFSPDDHFRHRSA